MRLPPTLDRFLAWWGGELRAVLPGAARREADDGHELSLDVGRDEIVASRHQAGEEEVIRRWPRASGAEARAAGDAGSPETWIGGFDPERGTVVVRPASGLALVREATLPLAAEENLREVLGFEMERLTPFRVDEVYFQHRVERRDARARKLVVRLAVAPRRLVDEALAHLPDWGLEPVGDESNGPRTQAGTSLRFRSPRFRPRRRRWLNGVLVALNALLLAVVLALPVYRQHHVLEVLDQRLAAVRVQAAEAAALRERIAARQAGSGYLLGQRSARPVAVLLLEELSELLPDDTWLSRLEVKGADVHLHGTSASASALIALLESSALVAEVRFASPVLREGSTGRDRFHITASLVGTTGDAA